MIDDDCDGQADYQVIEPTDGKEPVLLMMDDDGDGKIDTVIVDQGRDGEPDVALYDTDGDGQLDFKGLFRKGEDEPYRYEKVEE
jgi:hypothetical protein